MSYAPKYSSEAKVEAELQRTFTGSSHPSSSEVITWIREVEYDVDHAGFGLVAAVDALIDVPEEKEFETPPYGTLAWFESLALDEYRRIWRGGRIVIPELTPIYAVNTLYRRTSVLGSTEVWEQLHEGLDGDFIILKSHTKAGLRGFAFYFFHDLPTPGYQSVKANYTYGLGLDVNVLSSYVTWKTCLRVLMALAQTTDPSSMTQFVGGLQSYVPSQYSSKMEEFQRRILEWETRWSIVSVAVGVL